MSGQAEWDGSGTSVGDQGSGALAVSIATVALEPHRLRLRCARVSRKASGSSGLFHSLFAGYGEWVVVTV